jgi:hypothetical protein
METKDILPTLGLLPVAVAMALLALNDQALAKPPAESDSPSQDFRWGHPITVSTGAQPDFLAGDWRKSSDRPPVLSAMRLFDLDGSGPKMWEWVGPAEGLLVWNETNQPEYQPTGKDLFGFTTWGRQWQDGLEALMSLDSDRNKKLTGDELANLWVWLDKNSDALVQGGELRPLPDLGIDYLDLSFEADGQGGVWSSVGAKVGPDGRIAPLREWWALGGMDREIFERYVKETLTNACVYQWEPENPADGTGGLVRYFIMENGTLAALTIPFEQAGQEEVVGLSISYDLHSDGTFRSRADMGDHWLENYLSIEDDMLVGMTGEAPKSDGKPVRSPMKWTAKKVSGPDLGHLLDAAVAKESLEIE